MIATEIPLIFFQKTVEVVQHLDFTNKKYQTMNNCQLKTKNKIAIPPLEIRKHRNTIGIPSPKISSEIVRVFKKNKRSNKDFDLCTTISFSI